MKTNNGGESWIKKLTGLPYYHRSIYFTSSDTGYLVGPATSSNGFIAKTTDGGESWSSIIIDSIALTRVIFTNASTGYCVGGHGSILKTDDKGVNWYKLHSGTSNDLFHVCFPDFNTGYVLGRYGTFLKTTDGGATWLTLSISLNRNITDIIFPTTDIGYIYDYKNNALLKTSDGGYSWNELAFPSDFKARFLYFYDSTYGFFAGSDGDLLKTTDGGLTWNYSHLFSCGTIEAIFFTDKKTGYLATMEGNIFKTTNGGVGFTEMTNTSVSNFSIYPNPASIKITVATNDKIFKNVKISLFDITGKMILQEKFNNQEFPELDISRISPGLYLLRIQTIIKTEFKKLIVQ